MSPEELREKVEDQESFVAFVRALAAEREEAQEVERDNPVMHMIDGAFDWKNADIPGFLYAALAYFDSRPFHKPEREPSWRMFADFLYFGKIYE